MFEKLPTVPQSEELIDRAFRRGSKASRNSGRDDDLVSTAAAIIADGLSSTVKKFPSFENLPLFYYELVDAIVGVDRVRIHLSRLGWAAKQIRKVAREYRKSSRDPVARKGALGRMASVLRSVKGDLSFLGEARDMLRKVPSLDPSEQTIIIAGYPNVGKSSFLKRVTGARPQIASYPFTTQGIVVGHYIRGDRRYQVVDTPGLLDRPLSEKNDIERQAVAALRHLNGVVLYIIDPSEHCGFLLEDQMRLLQEIRGWITLPVVVAANKCDISTHAERCDLYIDGGGLEMSTLTGDGVSDVMEKLLAALDGSDEEAGTSTVSVPG